MPQFKNNLISVNKLCTDLGCTIFFSPKACFVQENLKKNWLLGEQRNGLNFTQDNASNSKEVAHLSANNLKSLSTKSSTNMMIHKAKIWHLRMGHRPINKLKLLVPDLEEKHITN